MNIQLKKNKNTGYFGRILAGIGNKGRYQVSLNGNYFKEKQQISFFSNSNNTSQSVLSGGSGAGNVRTGADVQNSTGNTGSGGDLQLAQQGNTSGDGISVTNSVGVNYRDDWSRRISVYGSYTYSKKNNSGYRISSQQNIFSNGTFFNNQNSVFENLDQNHRFFFNIEYNIDSFNYLKVSPGFSYSTDNNNSRSTFDYYSSNAKTSDGYYNTTATVNRPSITGSILFNHRFRKRGRNFSMNFNGGTGQNYSDQDSRNNTTQYNSPAAITNLFLFNTQENDNHNYGIRFTYTEPLSKVRFLDLSFSQNLTYAKNDKKVYNIDLPTNVQVINAALSNEYENSYFNNRINLSVRTTEKKYNYTLGISVQPVNLKGISITKDSAYRPIKNVNIFPVARFSYNFSKTKSLSINYRGDAQQPSFSQLQDVMDVSNPQYVSQGNPNLKPSLNHNVNLFYNNFNFTTGRVLFTSLSVSTIKNQIINNTVRIGTSGQQLTTPQNVNGYYTVNGFYNYSKPYNNRMFVVSLNGIANFNHNVNLVDSVRNIGKNWVIGQGLNVDFVYKEWLELTTGINYNLNSVSYKNRSIYQTILETDRYSSWTVNTNVNIEFPHGVILRSDLEYNINQGLTGEVGRNQLILGASIEKQFFKTKNANVRLQAFDIFNQNSNINRSISANSIIDSRSNRLTRFFMLTFTYRLQKFGGN